MTNGTGGHTGPPAAQQAPPGADPLMPPGVNPLIPPGANPQIPPVAAQNHPPGGNQTLAPGNNLNQNLPLGNNLNPSLPPAANHQNIPPVGVVVTTSGMGGNPLAITPACSGAQAAVMGNHNGGQNLNPQSAPTLGG